MNVIEKKISELLAILLSILLFIILIIFFSFYFVLNPNLEFFNIGIFISIIIYNFVYGVIIFNDKNITYILFSPLFWYKFVSTLFFGIGPLSYYFGSQVTIAYMHSYFFTTNETLTKITLISLFSILLTDCIFLILNYLSPLPKQISRKPVNKKLLLFYSLTIGFFFKYVIIIPSFQLGINTPGISYVFSSYMYVAIFLAYNIGQKINRYKILFYFLTFIETSSSFLILSKEYLYIAIIFSSFTVFYHNKNLKTILTTGLVAGFMYVTVIQNLFEILRVTGEGNFGITSNKELVQAYDTAKSLRDGVDELGMGSLQSWWDRLSYVKYQAYAVEAYDQNYSGETLQNFKYIFIPRILYPEKPNLNPGADYNSLVQKSFYEKSPNSTGPGIFVEAYWNGGWLYLTYVTIYFSFLLFYASKIIVKNLKQKNYVILMFAVNAIYIGRSIDSWFVGVYGGLVLNMVVIYFFSVAFYKGIEHILNTEKIRLNE